jgi:hypothetical protein
MASVVPASRAQRATEPRPNRSPGLRGQQHPAHRRQETAKPGGAGQATKPAFSRCTACVSRAVVGDIELGPGVLAAEHEVADEWGYGVAAEGDDDGGREARCPRAACGRVEVDAAAGEPPFDRLELAEPPDRVGVAGAARPARRCYTSERARSPRRALMSLQGGRATSGLPCSALLARLSRWGARDVLVAKSAPRGVVDRPAR